MNQSTSNVLLHRLFQFLKLTDVFPVLHTKFFVSFSVLNMPYVFKIKTILFNNLTLDSKQQLQHIIKQLIYPQIFMH